jgi:hypothetical protein
MASTGKTPLESLDELLGEDGGDGLDAQAWVFKHGAAIGEVAVAAKTYFYSMTPVNYAKLGAALRALDGSGD